MVKTIERLTPEKVRSQEENLLYLRHLFAYEFVKNTINQDSLVLDLGCGEGYGTSLLSQNLRKVIGLDVDKKTVAEASQRYGSKNCFFEVYDGLKIPYGDDSFDAVVSMQVIEHVKDDIHYVSEAYRILKKNGIFILTTPNKTYRLKPGQKPWNRFHFREYYPEELENLLKKYFSEVKVWGIRGIEEIQKKEMQRAKQNSKIASFDPLNLRNLIPEPWELAIKKAIKKMVGKTKIDKKNKESLDKYRVEDYYVIKDKVQESLDLLGVCRK